MQMAADGPVNLKSLSRQLKLHVSKILQNWAFQNLYVPAAMHYVAKRPKKPNALQEPNPLRILTKICAWSQNVPGLRGQCN